MPYMGFKDALAELLGTWSAELNPSSIAFRIAISLIFSAIIGCERANKRHAAGLRTFMVVSLAGTLAMMTDMFIFPIPIISAAAVIGIAILSSNSVLFSARSQIKGLTTSTGLWTAGILGITIGAGFYTAALIIFGALLLSLSLLPSFERVLKDRSNHFEIHLELKNKSNLQDFVTTIRQLGLIIDDIESNPAYINSGLSVYSISLTISSAELKKYKKHSEIIDALRSIDYIYHIEEIS